MSAADDFSRALEQLVDNEPRHEEQVSSGEVPHANDDVEAGSRITSERVATEDVPQSPEPDPAVIVSQSTGQVIPLPPRPPRPISEQLRQYMIELGLENNTVRIYMANFVRWVDWCGTGHDPLHLDGDIIQDWCQTLPQSAGSRSHARGMLKHLAAMTGAPGEPWKAVKIPRPPKRASRAISHLQAGELVRAAMHVGGREGLAVLVGMFTAARRSEIAGMRWDKVNWDDDTIVFWRPKVRDWHTVPMHPLLRTELEQRRPAGHDDLWFFPGRNGGHISPALVGEWVKYVAAFAGLKGITPHILRHTALTEANDVTRDLRAVQELAGHSRPETTARYTRASETRMREAVASLDWLD